MLIITIRQSVIFYCGAHRLSSALKLFVVMIWNNNVQLNYLWIHLIRNKTYLGCFSHHSKFQHILWHCLFRKRRFGKLSVLGMVWWALDWQNQYVSNLHCSENSKFIENSLFKKWKGRVICSWLLKQLNLPRTFKTTLFEQS
jgi:hypothetical protein